MTINMHTYFVPVEMAAAFRQRSELPWIEGLDDGNGRMEHAAEILGMAGWFTREIIDGAATVARATNERDIEPQRKVDIDGQKVANYHANMMPPPERPKPFPVDRKAALKAEGLLATLDEARAGWPLTDRLQIITIRRPPSAKARSKHDRSARTRTIRWQ